MEEKFNWSGGICAPKEQQMQVYYGQIIADDYQYPYSDIVGTVNQGWGSYGEAMGTSNGLHKVPHTLEFTWYSVVEDKFYAGHWELDTIKIKKLFKEGFIQKHFDDFRKGTYDTFIIGMAPKGRLVLWMYGGMHQVEVGSFQGQEIKITKKEAYEDFQYVFKPDYRTDMLKPIGSGGVTDPLIYQRIQEKGYPDPKIYDDYRERFNWRLRLILPNDNILRRRRLEMCNGEKERTIENDPTLILPYSKRAIPYYFDFVWITKEKKEYRSQIALTADAEYIRQANKKYNGPYLPWDFYETEMYKVFKEKLDKDIPIDIVVDVSNNKEAKIYVEQDGKQYYITQIDSYVEPY